MVLHQFPDLHWLKAQANTRFANRQVVNGGRLENDGWPTVILNAKTKGIVRDNIRGPLSIFTNLSGNSVVAVDKKRVTQTPETFFISNAGQHYTPEIKESVPTETFNIHFGEYFVEKALQSYFSTTHQLLENKGDPNRKEFGFHNRIVPNNAEFHSILNSIQQNEKDDLFVDEQLFQLLSLLLREEKKVHEMYDRFMVIKSSTREEILKRLIASTDYLHVFYINNPSLDELARISCLSKFHFLRLFKIAYGQTPHQFITALKINKAKELLQNTCAEVKIIAHQLGFDNTSAFSRLFHHQTGVYPSQFRANS